MRTSSRKPWPGDPGRLALLGRELRDRVDGEVRFDAATRGAYSTDGSDFRQVPLGVVLPRTIEAGVAAVSVCSRHGAPLLSRGGGTSLSGQCTNRAVVIDWSKYCNRVLSVDSDRRTCVVEPGIVLDELNRQLAPHGLRFGPEPASHPNCTIGGMIGNNSCGATAQRTGKVVDNTARLEVLTYDGTRFWCGPTGEDEYAEIVAAGGRRAEIYRQLRELADSYAGEIRARFPDIPRRVSAEERRRAAGRRAGQDDDRGAARAPAAAAGRAVRCRDPVDAGAAVEGCQPVPGAAIMSGRPHPHRAADTGWCRGVPGHPSRHGANIDANWSRPR